MQSEVILFGSGFVLLMLGILFYTRSDESAFNRANQDIKAMRADINQDLKLLSGEIGTLTSAWKDLKEECVMKLDKHSNQLEGIELEIQRLKEKQEKIQLRQVPTTSNINLKLEHPVPVRVVHTPQKKKAPQPTKTPLLEKAGITKRKK